MQNQPANQHQVYAQGKDKPDSGIVTIHGKQYRTVALRISEFRDTYPTYGIETDVISQADLVTVKATITNEEGRIVSTGYAEEDRSQGSINRTSALENCETSAVGRALAFLGLAGTEIASADEVAGAIGKQSQMDALAPILLHQTTLRNNLSSVMAIKEYLASHSWDLADEAWNELSEDEQRALWVAPSKGGIFTTQERREIKGEGRDV